LSSVRATTQAWANNPINRLLAPQVWFNFLQATNRAPSVQHLRVFGYMVHVKITQPNLKKLEDRSTPMVMFGYEQGSTAYRVYNPAMNKIQVSHDVIFDEDMAWD
jgi:hypothetical protein